ncbi:unnamed protein product [Closterium sp. Yama58-4]|nr:unnamed protein product [Closterium sp. Yama58-4]
MYAPGGKTPAHSASSGDLFGGKTSAHSASGGDLRGGVLPAPTIAGLPHVLDSARLSHSARHHTRSRVPRRPRGGGGRASARQLTVADVMREHPGYCVGSMSSKRAVLPRDKVLHPGGTYYLSKPALATQSALEAQSAEVQRAEGKGAGKGSAEAESAEGQRTKQQSAKQRGAQAANEPAGRGLEVEGTTASSSAIPARDALVGGGGDAQAEEYPGGADHGLLVDILGDSQPEKLPQRKDGPRENQQQQSNQQDLDQQNTNQRRGMHMVKGILTLDIASDASDNDDYDCHDDDNFYGFTSHAFEAFEAFEAASDAESDADSFATTGCTGGSVPSDAFLQSALFPPSLSGQSEQPSVVTSSGSSYSAAASPGSFFFPKSPSVWTDASDSPAPRLQLSYSLPYSAIPYSAIPYSAMPLQKGSVVTGGAGVRVGQKEKNLGSVTEGEDFWLSYHLQGVNPPKEQSANKGYDGVDMKLLQQWSQGIVDNDDSPPPGPLRTLSWSELARQLQECQANANGSRLSPGDVLRMVVARQELKGKSGQFGNPKAGVYDSYFFALASPDLLRHILCCSLTTSDALSI